MTAQRLAKRTPEQLVRKLTQADQLLAWYCNGSRGL